MDDRNKFCCILWIFSVFFCYMYMCRSQPVLVVSRRKDGGREQPGSTLLADERRQRGQRHHVSRCLRCVCSTSDVMLLLSICCTCTPHVDLRVFKFSTTVLHTIKLFCASTGCIYEVRSHLMLMVASRFLTSEEFSPTPTLYPFSPLFFLFLTSTKYETKV